MQVTAHFSLEELTRSETAARRGLDNSLPPQLMPTLKRTAQEMEQIRRMCGGRPITVYSCWRAPLVNAAVGGSPTSSHKDAKAVDFRVSGLSIVETIAIIRRSGELEFDQLIDEFNSWVHIGFGHRMRGHVLSARKVQGKTVYNHI